LASAERGAFGDDGDAGKIQFGIDAGRHVQRGDDPRNAEQKDGEIDESTLHHEGIEAHHSP
jgi:hypothetical protein